LFDKITILEIKQQKILLEHKLINIRKELSILQHAASNVDQQNIAELIDQLKKVNSVLWEIEEQKRLKEKLKCFDNKFIELARSVYINNDQRALIKQQISLITNSSIVEEKSYE
jgi:hypothetical protein